MPQLPQIRAFFAEVDGAVADGHRVGEVAGVAQGVLALVGLDTEGSGHVRSEPVQNKMDVSFHIDTIDDHLKARTE